MFQAVNRGAPIPAQLLGEFRDSSSLQSKSRALRGRLDEDGYVFLRGALPVEDVMAARREVLERLAAVGEIAAPAIGGVVTGRSDREAKVPDLTAFWKAASEGARLRNVTHGAALRRLMEGVLDGEVVGHDFVYLRVAAPGRALDLHYDYPFFTRGTKEVFTTWIALGEVPATDGPLYVVEGSNRFADLIEAVREIDQTGVPSRKLAYDQPAHQFAAERKARILTADFKPGDMVIFGLLTAHGSLDNCSPIGRARVSCDLRYQRADAPRDERFFGSDPAGVTGNGYADINGAKPLTASWQTR
jgi:Phytanoyl-CoA dioxygenase (PhyH)